MCLSSRLSTKLPSHNMVNVAGEGAYLGQQRKPLRTPRLWAAPCQELCLRGILCMRGIWVSLKGARISASARQELSGQGAVL